MELTRRGPSASLTGCCEASEVPEVAVEQAAEPLEVLADDVLVEVQLLLQRRQPVGCRVASEDRSRRVTERLGRGEDDDRDQEHHQEPEQHPADDEAPDASTVAATSSVGACLRRTRWCGTRARSSPGSACPCSA